MMNEFVMRLRKLGVLAREMLQLCMFSFMSHRVLRAFYNTSIISDLNKGLLSFVSLILACIQLYFFYHAYNKNIDAWINIISALAGALLTGIATYGAMIAVAIGAGFAAGIWVFIAGLAVGVVNQLFLLGIRLYRAYSMPSGSIERNEHQEAAWQHSFIMLQLLMTVTAILFTAVIPLSPIFATISCLAVVGLILSQIGWRMGSDTAKQNIKDSINCIKFKANQGETQHKYTRLFPIRNYLAHIQLLDSDQERHVFLELHLGKKLDVLKAIPNPCLKIRSKIHVLDLLLDALRVGLHIHSKVDLQKRYPEAFQSFWLEKGEVEQLYEAVLYYKSAPRQEILLTLN